MKIIDDYTQYSSEDVVDIKIRIYTFKKIVEELQNILLHGSTLSRDIESETTISIAPYIKQDYKLLNLREDLTFISILEVYEEWLNILGFCVITNQQEISKNKTLKKHWIEMLKICLTIYEPMLMFFKQEEV